ncbi:MAG: aminoacetone oxidase family FAD-binding enzyme [Bacteroidales bacterium]|nr:aminoacetone oxidase family FAD-binding enzyme [Bacteroidota bacterium]NLN99182.1 aminoacetone oxidase family FAD-binding enzyme [Bacteroidales bacterium]
MQSDIIIIGGGAAGLMAAYASATSAPEKSVSILEKMPRPGRKLIITGKGRCNFTNVKAWNEFSQHIRSKSNFPRPAFFNLPPRKLIDLFNEKGLETVVERGDRAFPLSYRAADVVDLLADACRDVGVQVLTGKEVTDIQADGTGFSLFCADGDSFSCARLIIATGGLSYPGTGSTGDGYGWARSFGHTVTPLFPSLTALVPKNYKREPVGGFPKDPALPGHIDRALELAEAGAKLCGVRLKNVGLVSWIDGHVADAVFGDLDFTDGGIEGPLGFQVSRTCVKSILNGGHVTLVLDLKPGVSAEELSARVDGLWEEIKRDPRSRSLSVRDMTKVLLGKLMPRELIAGFLACNPGVLIASVKRPRRPEENARYYYELRTGKRERRPDDLPYTVLPDGTRFYKPLPKVYSLDLKALVEALKGWRFEIAGFVGYERAVVTAGGVSTDEVLPKTLESRLRPGLYFCGEVLDIDADTGGYNLQLAFSTGFLAGLSAAKSLMG